MRHGGRYVVGPEGVATKAEGEAATDYPDRPESEAAPTDTGAPDAVGKRARRPAAAPPGEGEPAGTPGDGRTD